MTEQRIFFSVGEPSGDLHGANLIRVLRARAPALIPVGFGGPRMAEAGCRLDCDMTDLAVMGAIDVLKNLHTFRQRLRLARSALEQHQPRAVVLIDYPGFNWWIARHAKELGIPVYYYGVPQLWGWAPWRVHKLRRLVDHVLCKLPFEPAWFEARGVKARFVGHPYFDELASRKLDADYLGSMRRPGTPLITLLPGSRHREVRSSLPVMADVVRRIAVRVPHARFACASFSEEQARTARSFLAGFKIPVEIYTRRTPELIEAANCCLACSGSVSLELLYHRKPSIILYRISPWMYGLQHAMRTARYITLVNLFAAETIQRRPFERLGPAEREKLPMPEYLLARNDGEGIARQLVHWLSDPQEYASRVAVLDTIRQEFARTGASQRAADYILESLGPLSISPPSPPSPPSPHFGQRATIKPSSDRDTGSPFPRVGEGI